MDDIDIRFMYRALEIAAKATGRTNPNPMVGAVIVKNDEIVGEGFHHKAGTPHAEIHALNAAGNNAFGATMYVTLEPCSHYGKTPPCVETVIKAGIKRVVIATIDPNPRVAGKGLRKLENAGIDTRVGVLENEAVKLNEVFFKYIRKGMPYVALKTAMTLDGKIASFNGDSRWITNEESRNFVHRLRNTYDAVLVGIGTVLKDDPWLNTRLNCEDIKDPIRIIIDTNLDLPRESRISKTALKQRTLVFCSHNAAEDRKQYLSSKGIKIIPVQAHAGLIELEDVLKILGKMEICSVLVEGGGEINAYLMQQHLVDKVYWFIAPKIIGGKEAPSPIGGKGIELMDNALELKEIEIQRFQEDLMITGYL